MAIHGHTRITLCDSQGNKEIIEKDNIITDLVANILGSNFSGALDYATILPLLKEFNGCLLYNSPRTEVSASDVLVPKGATVTAHAGDEAYTGLDTTCGTPNELESGYVTNGYRWVWDWATSNGNGVINAVSLTRGTMGLVGRNEVDPKYPSMFPLSKMELNVPEARSLFFKCALFDWDSNRAFEIGISGMELTINVFGFGGAVVSLYDDLTYDTNKIVKTYKFTLTTKPSSYYSVQYAENKIYLCFTKSATSVQVDTIDLANNTITEVSHTFAGTSFKTSYYDNSPMYSWRVNMLPIVKGYIYIPRSNDFGIYKCSLSNAADVAELPSRLEHRPYILSSETRDSVTSFSFGCTILENDNLVYGSCAVVNDVLVPTKPFNDSYMGTYNTLYDGGVKLRNGVYLVTSSPRRSVTRSGLICLAMDSISTINILPQAVVKDASRTMKLEYTITVEG